MAMQNLSPECKNVTLSQSMNAGRVPAQGPILPLEMERVESHADDTLDLWEGGTPGATASPPWGDVSKVQVDDLVAMVQGAEHVVVSLTRCAPDVLWDFIAAAVAVDTRLYVYAAATEQNSPVVRALLNGRNSGPLLRLGAEPPGDWLVANGTGRLFVGSPGGDRRWVVTLDRHRASALHNAFVWQFWHRATLEAIPGSRTLRAPLDAPRPEPAPESETSLGAGVLLRDGGTPPLLQTPEVVVSPDGAGWPGNPRTVLTPHDRTPFERLTPSAGLGTTCAWTPAGLPRLALSRQRAALVLEEGPSRLQLELDAREAVMLLEFVEDLARQPAWRFHPGRRLGDVKGSIWPKDGTVTLAVSPEVDLDEGTRVAPELESMATVEPPAWRKPTTLACVWRHRWKVTPPKAPGEARPARLTAQWNAVDEYARTQVDALRRHVEHMDNEERSTKLLDRLKGLVGSWVGVQSTRRRILSALDEIGDGPLSKRPAEADALITALRTQHSALRALRVEAWTRIEQAEVDEARAAAEKAHLGVCAAHRTTAEKLGVELDKARDESAQATEHLATARRSLDASQIAQVAHEAEVRAAREAQAAEEIATLELEITGRRTALAALPVAVKSASKSERHRIEVERKRLASEESGLRNKLGQVKAGIMAPVPALPEIDAVRAQIRTFETRLRELAPRIADLSKKCETARTEAGRPFVFLAPAPKKAPAGVPDLPPSPDVPPEALPSTGTLLEHGTRRYLQIKTWEQLDPARSEAKRLNAKLVAI